MLQSFGRELNYFGAKDDTCHRILLEYINLQTCLQPAGYVGEILKSGNASLWLILFWVSNMSSSEGFFF